MECNSLKSVLGHLENLGYLQGPRVIPDGMLTEAKAELAKLQQYAEQNYGIKESLFEIKHRSNDLGRGAIKKTMRLEFNIEAFKKINPIIEQQNASFVDNKGQISLPFSQETQNAQSLRALETLDNVYNGEIYNTKAEMQQAKRESLSDLSFSPSTTIYNPTNYANVVEYKELLLKSLNKRLATQEANRRNDKSIELKQEIAKSREMIQNTELEIHKLKNDPDIMEKTFAIFNKDLAAIDKIFANGTPSLENIFHIDDMISYFNLITNYSATNRDNTFVNTEDPKLIEPDVKAQLDKLRGKIAEYETKIYDAKREYLLKAINESEKLKALYPEAQLEEIREKLLDDQQDIGIASLLFGTINEDFGGTESLLSSLIRKRLEDSRNLNKGFAAGLMQKLNFSEDAVKKVLSRMGYGLGKFSGEVNYSLFYQKTTKGNKTGRLINKFSHSWFTDISRFTTASREAINTAFKEGRFEEINPLLATKYTWINERADFIEIGKLPEIINDPAFSMFAPHFSLIEADAYKAKLIAQIGQYEYDKIVELQTDMVDDYLNFIRNELSTLLSVHGVVTPSELPSKVITGFNILASRNNPFKFIDSHTSGKRGRVQYDSNEYQSHIKYNTFVPKNKMQRVSDGEIYEVDSGYYDKDFSIIEQDSDLLKFWETLYDASTYINTVVNDASTTLGHGSLLQMKKSMLDTFLDKEMGALGKTGHVFRETGQTLSNLFSKKDSKIVADDMTDVAKSGIHTIQDDVNNRLKVILMQMGTYSNTVHKSGTKIKLLDAPFEVQEIFERIMGKSVHEIISEVGEVVTPNMLREYLTEQVMEEQTFNLPVMMRAYLDVVSELAAQKEALPEIQIFKGLYDNIGVIKKDKKNKVEKTITSVSESLLRKSRESGIEDRRWMSQLRMKTWVNRNVKGLNDTEIWGRIGFKDSYWKNYTAQEKAFKKEALAYKAMLQDKIDVAEEDGEINQLTNELDEVNHALENLGQIYAASAIWDSVVNKLSLFVGIGLNVSSQVANRFMGYWTGMINDTGRYWPEGAFNSSNAFINRKGLRILPGMSQYRNEIRKTKLMVEKLAVLQDATNELDRAKRNSGFRNAAKILNPFYLVEYTEWHNQVPQILSVLQGMFIKSADGSSTVPIFNGTSFPAFNIVDGELVLKPEYDTVENNENWINFSTQKSSDNKSQITQTLAVLNGDYSKLGSTFIKSKIIGKTAMMFKTWAGKQFSMRFATNQTDLALGIKDFDGAYSGGLKNPKTAVGTAVTLAASAAITATMGTGLVFGGIIGAGLLGYAGVIAYKNRNEDAENFSTMKQLSAVGLGILRKGIGLPINAISGKHLIEAHKAEGLNLTKEEKENFQMVINELVGLLYLTLIKVMIKGMAGQPDDDDEPKTINGKPNPYYMLNPPPSKEETEWYNLAENTITRMIEDATMWSNPAGVYNLLMRPAGTESWLLKVGKLADGGIRLTEGNDVLSGGVNSGKSKTMTSIKETFLPAVMNEWTEGEFLDFGFKKKKAAEFNKNELMDKWFKSDYSKDRKSIDSDRAEKRLELTDYWKKEVNYDKADGATQREMDAIIKRTVNKQLDIMLPLDIRAGYDAEQNKIKK